MIEEEIKRINERYFENRRDLINQISTGMEKIVGPGEVKTLRKPEGGSHKGMNGKVLIIGGSALFHGASIWALKAVTRIADMVFYASVPENLEIAKKMKSELLDYIAIPREEIEAYINEADAVLIGPGMVRPKDGTTNYELRITNLKDIENVNDEGEQTRAITDYLLHKYSEKQWVIDAGALQVLNPEWIPPGAILTPHQKEFETLYLKSQNSNVKSITQISKPELETVIKTFAFKYRCNVVLKGESDIITDGERVKYAVGGNPGMTKGGTGDVLAGVIAGLAAKNEPFLAACAGSFLNKLAGDLLFEKVNTMFNATDLVEMIPEAFNKALNY